MRYLLLLPIVLIAGYAIARNHHRLRNLGIGTLVGSSLPPLPGTSDHHGHGHAHDHHDHSDGHDHHDHNHGHDHHDHSFGADSTHTDTTGHGF